jgi:hypothetical protein
MPQYRVKGPDGSTYNVTAPDGATSEEVLAQVQAQAQKPAPTKAPRSGWQTAGDFAGDVVDNVLPNWGDELLGGIPAAIWSLGTDEGLGAAFDRGQAEFKANQDQYDAEHPNLAWASTIGGIGAGLFLPAGAAMRGVGMGSKMLQGAKVGAAYGALSGAGEGEGLAERGANSLSSGAMGAGLGALATPVLAAGARGGRFLRENIPGAEAATRRLANIPRALLNRRRIGPNDRATAQANRMAAEAMGEGNIQRGFGTPGAPASPEAIASEVAARQAMNVPAIPGDVTEPMRNLTSWASRGMGPGQRRVVEAVERRKADEATRVRQHVIETMGPVGDPLQQMEQHAARAKAQAAPKYAEAYAQPMVVTPEIQAIMQTPAFAEAVPQAMRNIRNAMRNPEALGLRLVPNPQPGTMAPNVPHIITPEGMLVLDKNLSTEGFDQVIRAMRDNGRAAMNTSGFRPVDTTNSVHINSRARDLRQQIADQNQAYGDVTAQYADDMAQRDAFNAGQGVANQTGHEINATARAMPENAQPSWAIGARTALADTASEYGARFPTGDASKAVERAIGDPTKQQAIGSMMGNNGSVRDLLTRLEAEQQGNLLFREVNGNSRTASRQALDADLDAQLGGKSLSALSPRGMLSSAVDFLASRANGQYRNAVKDRVSQIVTESDPRNIEELMQQIAATAEKDRAFGDLLHRSGIVAAKAAGQRIQPVVREGSWATLSDVPDDVHDAAMAEYFAANPKGVAHSTVRNGNLIVEPDPEYEN